MQHAHHQVSQTTFQLEDVHCLDCAAAVEAVLKAQPHITGVHLDWANNVVHVGYHADMLDEAEIRRLIATTGCRCAPPGHAEHVHAAPAVSPTQALAHLAHGVETQPINMGTKHDRMQYEMPATAAQAHAHVQHDGSHAAPDTDATDHAAHAQAHDHMGHDMSDPGMAAAMERDMRNKFWVACREIGRAHV